MERQTLAEVVPTQRGIRRIRRNFLRTGALGLAAFASGLAEERDNILPKQAKVVTTELGLFVQYEEPVSPNQQGLAKKDPQDKDKELDALVDHYSAHPVEKTKQYPTDAIRREQLATYNIHILPTGDIDLLVRPSALEREPVFRYAVESSKRFEGRWPQTAIVIILLDTEHLALDTKVPEDYKDYYKSHMQKVLEQLPPVYINGSKLAAINGISVSLYFTANNPDFDLRDKSTGEILRNEDAKHNVNLIFLPVGGINRPKPSQSFYGPKDLSGIPISVMINIDRWRKEGLNYLPLMNRNPGFTLRHELKHILGEDELGTDTAAYSDRLEAFLKLMSGDNSYYDMVFYTPEGPVYVNSQNSSYTTA